MHSDWVNAWDQPVLDALVSKCINGGIDCPAGTERDPGLDDADDDTGLDDPGADDDRAADDHHTAEDDDHRVADDHRSPTTTEPTTSTTAACPS